MIKLEKFFATVICIEAVLTLILILVTGVMVIAYHMTPEPEEHVEVVAEVVTNSVVEKTNKKYYNITEEERYLLAKLAHAEASVCSQECQEAVVSVVFNRLESGKWRRDMNDDGKITLYDIVYYPNAFTPATNGAIDKWEPTSKDYAAVDAVLQNGPTVPTYVRYFRANHHFNNWGGYEGYCSIDNVYFGYFTDWQKGVW